jgi:Lar family restriction alleviation protein
MEDDMSQTDLLPCPFCGGEDIRSDVYIRDGREVECVLCGATTHAYNPDANQKAMAKWNTRVTPRHLTADEVFAKAGRA